jgi:cold shock CspA family protein
MEVALWITAGIVGTLGITALILNRLRVSSIRKQLGQPFPDLPDELSREWKKSRIWKFAPRDAVIGPTAGVNTYQALYHLSQIDGQVLEAVDNIYDPGHANSYHEIVSHLTEKFHAGDAAWEGAVKKYKGEVGEGFIAEHLRSTGHVVFMAESTNQEGWDAIVDGQAVNFKVGLGTDHIQHHLDRFPDIPVITVEEHADAFSAIPEVTCLEGVSGQEILDVTESTMESAVGLEGFNFKLPLITLALSSARNFSPVFQGHSDIGTAAKYTIADTAGKGLGAAGGAKAGAMIGALGGPVGAAAGSIIGGIAGAVVGKIVASEFKEKDLRQAVAEYQNLIRAYGKAYIRALNQKAASLERAASSLKTKFNLIRIILPTPGDFVRKNTMKAYLGWAQSCRAKANTLVSLATPEGLNQPEYLTIGEKVLAKRPKEPVYSSRFQRILDGLKKARKRIDAEKKKLGYK